MRWLIGSAITGGAHTRPAGFHAPAWWPSVAMPALLGVLVASAVTADAVFAHGLSLRWAAPWLGGWTPPLLSVLAVPLLLLLIVAGTFLRRHWPGRGQLPIALLFTATQVVGFSLANIEPLKLTLLAVFAAWLGDVLVNDRKIRVYLPDLLIWLVVLMFSLASVVNGLLGSLVAQYSIIAKLLMFFIVSNIVRTPAQLVFAVRLIVGLGMASAVVSLLQEGVFYFLKLPLSLDDNASKYWFKETPLGWMIRATAFHPTAQNLSHFLLMALAMLLVGPFAPRARWAGAPLLALGIFFTFTGNGLMVMAFVLLAAPVVRRPAVTLHYVSMLALLGLLAYESGIGKWLFDRYLEPISGKSAEDRVALLQLGLQVIERHPVIGMGLGNFARLSPQPVHNAYLQLATEIGVVPTLLLCLILLGIAARLLIGIAHTRIGPLRSAAKGVLLAFLALLLHFLFEPFINSLVSWSIIGLAGAAALVLAMPQPVSRPTTAQSGSGRSIMYDKTLYDYWLICYRKRLVILLLVLTAVIGALAISASLPPVYEARAMFYVPSSATTQRSNAGEQDVPLPASNQDDAKANIGILKGRDALRALHASFPTKSIDSLQRDVDFTAGRDGTIQVYVRDRDPGRAAAVANAYITYFNRFLMAQMRERSGPRIESLNARIAEVNGQLHQVALDRRIAAAAAGLAFDGQTRELVHTKEDLGKELDDLRGAAVARSESDARGQSTRLVATAGVDQLERQLADIDVELARVRVRTLPNHPDQISLLERQATARTALQERLRTLSATDLSRADTVARMIKRRELRLHSLPEAQAQLADLDQQYGDLRAASSFLKRSLEDLTLNSARPSQIGIGIETAFAPEIPVFPIAWLNAVIAAVLAILTGILYALLLDYIAESAASRKSRLLGS